MAGKLGGKYRVVGLMALQMKTKTELGCGGGSGAGGSGGGEKHASLRGMVDLIAQELAELRAAPHEAGAHMVRRAQTAREAASLDTDRGYDSGLEAAMSVSKRRASS